MGDTPENQDRILSNNRVKCDGFVGEPFQHAILNNMRNYLEFEDKEKLTKEMVRRLENS